MVIRVAAGYIVLRLCLFYGCNRIESPNELLISFKSKFKEARNSNWNQEGAE